jgi:mRNA interferase MazF
MKSTTPFDVVLIPFPFADLSTNKRRPCLVLARLTPKGLPRHFVVCMITSQLAGVSFEHDHVLGDYALAGLPKPSLVRVAKLVTVDQSVLLKKLGALSPRDRAKVRSNVQALFGHARPKPDVP